MNSTKENEFISQTLQLYSNLNWNSHRYHKKFIITVKIILFYSRSNSAESGKVKNAGPSVHPRDAQPTPKHAHTSKKLSRLSFTVIGGSTYPPCVHFFCDQARSYKICSMALKICTSMIMNANTFSFGGGVLNLICRQGRLPYITVSQNFNGQKLAEKLENKKVKDIIKVPQLDRNLSAAQGDVRKYFPD